MLRQLCSGTDHIHLPQRTLIVTAHSLSTEVSTTNTSLWCMLLMPEATALRGNTESQLDILFTAAQSVQKSVRPIFSLA